jgi:hypothetical protein
MKLTYEEFKEHIKKNGITLAKTTEKFIDIPEGTKLYFDFSKEEDCISTYAGDLNGQFNYNFDYQWDNSWIEYEGLFEIEEEIKEIGVPTKIVRIFKYATGENIPKGAKYLGTVTQTKIYDEKEWKECWLVWHYFLVEVEE